MRQLLYCRSCQKNVKTFKTSNIIEDNTSEMPNKIIRMIDINLRSVVATTSAGGGLTSLRRLCTNLNFPQPKPKTHTTGIYIMWKQMQSRQVTVV